MKSSKKEELHSRREFFRKAAKASLPILGFIAATQIPFKIQAMESHSSCSYYSCTMSCSGGCAGCSGGCTGDCGSLCGGSCSGSCSGSCYYSCQGSCAGKCSGYNYGS